MNYKVFLVMTYRESTIVMAGGQASLKLTFLLSHSSWTFSNLDEPLISSDIDGWNLLMICMLMVKGAISTGRPP
jgi:hypothetical protein